MLSGVSAPCDTAVRVVEQRPREAAVGQRWRLGRCRSTGVRADQPGIVLRDESVVSASGLPNACFRGLISVHSPARRACSLRSRREPATPERGSCRFVASLSVPVAPGRIKRDRVKPARVEKKGALPQRLGQYKSASSPDRDEPDQTTRKSKLVKAGPAVSVANCTVAPPPFPSAS